MIIQGSARGGLCRPSGARLFGVLDDTTRPYWTLNLNEQEQRYFNRSVRRVAPPLEFSLDSPLFCRPGR